MLSFLLLKIAFAAFLAVTLVQLVAWWGVFGRLNSASIIPRPAGAQPALSVLLCARNEAANLRRYLPTVLEQDYPAFEVLVVDDASEDETAAVLTGFQEKYPHLRILRVAEKTSPGKKFGLAQGIAAARHELLVFTDADCQPAGPHWLAALTAPFARPAVGIVLGFAPAFAHTGWWNGWVRYETIFTALQYLSLAQAGMPYMGVGRNLAWRKSLFAQTGGFAAHAHLASGDDDLLVNAAARRGNTAVCLDPESFVFSEGKSSWRAWLRQKRRHLSAGRLYRPVHRLVLGALALSQVLHYALAVWLLLAGFGTNYVLFGVLLRATSVFILYRRLLPLLGEQKLLSRVLLFDALMAGYYAAFVPFSLLRYKRSNPWT